MNVHFDIMQAYGIHCNFFVQPVYSQLIRFDNVLVGCWWQHYTYLHTHIYLYILPDCNAHTQNTAQPAYTDVLSTIQDAMHKVNSQAVYNGCIQRMMYLVFCNMHSLVAVVSLVGPKCVLLKKNITSLDLVSSVRHLFSFWGPAVLNTFRNFYVYQINCIVKINMLIDYL